MSETIKRRTMLKAVLASATLPLAAYDAKEANAASMPVLDPKDPLASSLGYVADTTKVNQAANPAHKLTQKCVNCAQFQGKATDKLGVCNLFAGKQVAGPGWCKVWVQKPGV
jgi:hypothetical protein